jgi:hypothetical protein
VTAWNGCGAPGFSACNDDACGLAGHSLNSTVTFNSSSGIQIGISVGGYLGATGDFMLRVQKLGKQKLQFFGGPASIGYRVSQGPPLGTCLAAVTLNQGVYPWGWFFGIDVGLNELAYEMGTYPFWTTLGNCGESQIGPFAGVPTGLTVYGVALAAPPWSDSAIWTSAPSTFTVP